MLSKDYSICYQETISMLTRNITCTDKKISNVLTRDMKYADKEFQIFY